MLDVFQRRRRHHRCAYFTLEELGVRDHSHVATGDANLDQPVLKQRVHRLGKSPSFFLDVVRVLLALALSHDTQRRLRGGLEDGLHRLVVVKIRLIDPLRRGDSHHIGCPVDDVLPQVSQPVFEFLRHGELLHHRPRDVDDDDEVRQDDDREYPPSELDLLRLSNFCRRRGKRQRRHEEYNPVRDEDGEFQKLLPVSLVRSRQEKRHAQGDHHQRGKRLRQAAALVVPVRDDLNHRETQETQHLNHPEPEHVVAVGVRGPADQISDPQLLPSLRRVIKHEHDADDDHHRVHHEREDCSREQLIPRLGFLHQPEAQRRRRAEIVASVSHARVKHEHVEGANRESRVHDGRERDAATHAPDPGLLQPSNTLRAIVRQEVLSRKPHEIHQEQCGADEREHGGQRHETPPSLHEIHVLGALERQHLRVELEQERPLEQRAHLFGVVPVQEIAPKEANVLAVRDDGHG